MLMVISFTSAQSVYLNQFSAFSASKLFLILDHTKPYIEKIHSIDAELAGHVHILDVELQSLCGSGFSLIAMRMLAKPYHLGVNWPTTHCENKDGVHFFTLNFGCHNRYSKLLLCHSENSDIAWWNKNNSGWGFSVFLKKRTKFYFFLKKTQKNPKKQVVCLFLEKPGFFSTLVQTVCTGGVARIFNRRLQHEIFFPV